MKKCPKYGEVQDEARKNRLSGLKRVTCPRKIAGNWIQNGRRGKKIDGRMGEKRGRAIEKSPEVGSKTRKDEKKVGFTRKKRVRFLEKVPEIESKTGKIGKNGDFGAKKVGWGSGEKMGFTADFAML